MRRAKGVAAVATGIDLPPASYGAFELEVSVPAVARPTLGVALDADVKAAVYSVENLRAAIQIYNALLATYKQESYWQKLVAGYNSAD